ncbi:MAG: acyl-CoA dehydrogenase [Candidatus Protistobacter heckmanni]|nr:acyl-CoA dehydrogenase [Candidatus Protistobacter heckmanni]
MDFNFSEEKKQLADAVRRFCDKDYGFEARRKIVASAEGVSDQAWEGIAELGLTALPIPEAHGGFSGSAVDMLLVMQELGRGLVIEPYFATVFGAEFLKLAGGHDAVFEQVATGEVKLAAVLGERQARHSLNHVSTRAEKAGEGYKLKGEKNVVIHGAQSDKLIVSARVSGGDADTDGLAVFLVDRNAAGVSVTDYRNNDGMRAADVRFDDGAASLVGTAGKGWELIDAAANYGIALLCAAAVGLIDALNAATVEYPKTRQQFGTPISRFQALQYRMTEMFIHGEQARSMVYLAAAKVATGTPEKRRRAASAAKVRIGQDCRYVGQQAVQLHGSMVVTNELPAAHLFKRLAMIEVTLGDVDHHLARFASQPGFTDTESAAPAKAKLPQAA